MKKICKSSFVWALLLALLAVASPVLADEKEDKLIAELASPMESKVTDAMLKLEKQYPTSTKAFPTMKQLLKDRRERVRRKAARVLGALHADVDQENLKDILALTKGSDPREIMDGLISLRGLKAESTIPDLLPLLKHAHPNVIRDTCRTLAVLGNKDLIPQIEPLLNHPEPAVKKDAQDAIYKLRQKS